MNQDFENLQKLVRMLLMDLPTKRDWLDPVLEARLRDSVHAIETVWNARS